VAVKLLAPQIDVLFTNFEQTAEQIRSCKKIVHVGNPLKGDFATVTREEARERLGFEGKYRYSILSCGGSLGAGRINSEALLLMRDFSSKHPEVHHLHQAGVGNYPDVRAEFERLGLDKCHNLTLVDYIYDMPDRLAAADLVINRAGAMTISELALLQKPAILIPSPNVTDNHQYKNAKVLADAEAAVLLEETDLAEGRLTETVSALLSDREKRRIMAENFGTFAKKNANNLIYNELKTLVNSKNL
jgi:UDP-N-acetylglucosamine--N-acetylmuramyl-(pentapeptide) pyrophosphoryl-undecaprenol N-acetylglucosamine transferase